jgi:hypothetical protein
MVYNVKNEKFHCSTWIMVRKQKILENETQTLYDLDVGRKLNNVENETRKMYVLEYVEKH